MHLDRLSNYSRNQFCVCGSGYRALRAALGAASGLSTDRRAPHPDRGTDGRQPKGIAGDPGSEVRSFMLNGLREGVADAEAMALFSCRLSIFSEELQIGRERHAGWAFCHAVLSALWSFEDSDEWDGTIRLAGILEQLT